MSKPIKIATSPLTNTIFAGHLLKDGRTWAAGKQDVTMDCLLAVVEHAMNFGTDIQIQREDGTVDFEISVKDMRAEP